MTVRELVKELSKLSQDKEVLSWDGEWDIFRDVVEIEEYEKHVEIEFV